MILLDVVDLLRSFFVLKEKLGDVVGILIERAFQAGIKKAHIFQCRLLYYMSSGESFR